MVHGSPGRGSAPPRVLGRSRRQEAAPRREISLREFAVSGLLRPDGLADRAIFGIDPAGRIRFKRLYPADQLPPPEDFMTALRPVEG
jgi:hypothetical protein